MTTSTETPFYGSRFAPVGYDVVSRMVFGPVGGLAQLRDQAIELADLRAGERVLELGCGTGGFTKLLLARDTRVTAVDRVPAMLARAARRAPDASFVESDVARYPPERAAHEIVWLAFVMHELPAAARAEVLAIARAALAPNGRLIVVDHAVPTRGLVPKVMSRIVHGFEPAQMTEWMMGSAGGGMFAELAAAGFAVEARRDLARGTAVALVARVATRPDA